MIENLLNKKKLIAKNIPRSKNKKLFDFNLLIRCPKLSGIETTLLFKGSFTVNRTKIIEEIMLINP